MMRKCCTTATWRIGVTIILNGDVVARLSGQEGRQAAKKGGKKAKQTETHFCQLSKVPFISLSSSTSRTSYFMDDIKTRIRFPLLVYAHGS